jgi:dTDP-4-dehydrorhamnose 3,5-epimerase-like enzyme
MIKFIKHYFEHRDERGYLKGLLNKGKWEEVNLIFSNSGTIRGKHYHKKTYEVFIILEGEVQVALQKVNRGKLVGDEVKISVKEGDVFLIEPFIQHTFFVLKDSKWINVLSKKINPDNPDIHKILNVGKENR